MTAQRPDSGKRVIQGALSTRSNGTYRNLPNIVSILGVLPLCILLLDDGFAYRVSKRCRGEYQVVYRSVETYRRIFADAGFDVVSCEANAAYICPQMGCELVKKWKALVPQQCWFLGVIGRLAYWGFRIGYPWNTRVIPWLLARIGREFPFLTNHFFVLRPRCPGRSTT